ncbi:MAG: T9SS type A sorting domain-containing protein, partial [Candidatus Cloacimonadaceae bacterium]|nr:T9SS type A sorting domain-containing protein [Candidatus Cloacimonadaceae bacterium]
WLDNPEYVWGKHTQDYSFTYNGIHFIGLESYINYDSFRTYIYGNQSFTLNQMSWLNSTLNMYPDYKKVLFYHYDFSDQINLASMGIDMTLWGHVHSNQGSISVPPYNLGTRSVCDGNRAYRIIRVQDNQLIPTSTIYAGNSGQNIQHTFFPNNYGLSDSVLVVINNLQPLAFDNTLIKFKMPFGSGDYMVYGGVLEQVDTSGEYHICYVRIPTLGAMGTKYTSIKANSVSVNDPSLSPAALLVKNLYPNPFRDQQSLIVKSAASLPLSIKVYDLRGRLVANVFEGKSTGMEQLIEWNGASQQGSKLPTGLYLIRIQSGREQKTLKTIKVK